MASGARWRVEIRAQHLVGYGSPPRLPSPEDAWAAQRRREAEQRQRASHREELGIAPPTGSAPYPLHLRFARLHGRPDEELRGFAQRFGLLGLVGKTTAAYIEAMGRVAALLAAKQHETLADVERRYRGGLVRVAEQAIHEATRRVRSQATPRPVRAPREPIVEWRREIARVWALVRLAEASQRLSHGQPVPVEEVLQALVELGIERMGSAWDTSTPQARVERAMFLEALVAEAVNGRGPLRYTMTIGRAGVVQVPVADTLLDAIYASLAIALNGGAPIRFCKKCGRPFTPTRSNQEYCPSEGKAPSRCGQRHRQEKRRKNNQNKRKAAR